MLLSGIALAAPTDEEKAIARALFEQGRSLVKAGQWSEACPKLAESQRLDPGMGTLYNLADCHEHTGKLALAWAEFSEVLDLAKRAGQAEREKIAKDRVKALDARIAKVTLKRRPAEGSEVTLDGKAIGLATVDVPLPIDPGEHKVVVTRGGHAADKAFKVNAAASVEVELPVPAAEPPPAAPIATVEMPAPVVEQRTWQKPVAYAAGGVGLAAIGASVVLGFVAKGQWNDAEKQCPGNRCTGTGFDGWNDARSTATIGTVVFISGAVLVAAAAVLWLTAPSSPSTRTASSRW